MNKYNQPHSIMVTTRISNISTIACKLHLNYWVMHPVAHVSIKYWNNLHMQQSFFCVCEPPEDGRQKGPKHVV
jgi:hypothetical protein